MSSQLYEIEPFYGWLDEYDHEMDTLSPFHEVEHNLFFLDRYVNDIPVHPLWDEIGSQSLLLKILFADYEKSFAIIELFGEWNDLLDNDYRLLSDNCIKLMLGDGIQHFILVCENVFHIYLEDEDYYEDLQDELGEGWICLIRPRSEIIEEMEEHNVLHYFFHSLPLDELNWRGFKPQQLYQLVQSRMAKLLLP